MAQALPDILGRAADEAVELTHMSNDLQAMVARLVAEGADLRALEDAQAADLLTQRLAGLAIILRALARSAPPEAAADTEAALAGLPLADQARRLGGRPATPSSDAGDFSLWD